MIYLEFVLTLFVYQSFSHPLLFSDKHLTNIYLLVQMLLMYITRLFVIYIVL